MMAHGTVNPGCSDPIVRGVPMRFPVVTHQSFSPDGHTTPRRVRFSPWPAEDSAEMDRLHAEFHASLNRRDFLREAMNAERPRLRLRLAQALRRALAKLDP